jgi:hypothetical protein
MLIFRELSSNVKEVQAKLKDRNLFNEEERYLEKQKLETLMFFVEYVGNVDNYLSHKKSKERLSYLLKSGFKYQQTADYFKTSKNSIEALASYANKLLREKVGSDTIKLVREGRIEEARTHFSIAIGQVKPKEQFIEGISKLFPESKNAYISIEDCKVEMKFLLMFTHQNIEKLCKQINQEKIAHLLYILNSSDAKLTGERDLLYRLLKGEFNKSKDEEYISVTNQILNAIKDLHSQNLYYR